MIPVPFRRVALIAFLIGCSASAHLSAGEPTIETLLDGVPILSPDNEDLQQFRFTVETPLPFDVPLIMTLVYRRPDQYGMLTVAGKERTPYWFLSQKKSMMFDVTKGTALINEKMAPSFVFKVVKNKFTFSNGMNSKAEREISIDLASLMRDDTKNEKLAVDSSGNWRFTCLSKSGRTKFSATFENSDAFPLRRLEVRSAADDRLMFAIHEFAINAEAKTDWKDFPATESFPQTLKVIHEDDLKIESIKNGFDAVGFGYRALATQAALRNPKWRSIPFMANVDWAKTKENNDAIGPSLLKLLATGAAKDRPNTESAARPISKVK